MVPPSSPTLKALAAADGGRRRRRSSKADPTCVVAYLRVSSEEQAASGLGLEAQAAAIDAEVNRRGWRVCETFADEGVSGTVKLHKRPGMAQAIAALDRGEAGVLLIAKLDRLSRRLSDVLNLFDAADRAGWQIVVAGGGFDATTAQGRAMLSMAGAFAELERDLIAERTRDALAAAKARGKTLGHPSKVPTSVRRRIAKMRKAGKSWRAIADELNAAGIPSGSGKPRWQPATARRLCPEEAR